jgi:hypothetical protein
MAVDLTQKKKHFISRLKARLDALLADIEAMKGLMLEYNSISWEFQDADFLPEYPELDAAMLTNVVKAIMGLDATLTANNAQLLGLLYSIRG